MNTRDVPKAKLPFISKKDTPNTGNEISSIANVGDNLEIIAVFS